MQCPTLRLSLSSVGKIVIKSDFLRKPADLVLGFYEIGS